MQLLDIEMKQILVIDNNDIMRETIKDILQFAEFQVIQAESGSEGLRMIKKSNGSIDMIITNVLMPDMDGIEVIEATRKILPDLPIMAISGGNIIAAELYLKLAAETGADSTVVKPFDIDEFIVEVKKLLKGRNSSKK